MFKMEIVDLLGQRFSLVVVVARGKNKKGRARWVVRCDCGMTKTVDSGNLRSGRIKSCGHLRAQKKEMIGLRFNKLTVLEEVSRDKHWNIRYRVRCECGTESIVVGGALRGGHTKSCGCIRDAKPPIENFMKHVKVHEREPGCWEWTGPLRRGYGKFSPMDPATGKSLTFRASRWSYEHFVGPIPKGLVLDHLCARMPGGLGPPCVRPDHLEPVTTYENVVVRGVNTYGSRNARKTHCKQGHEFSTENTIWRRVVTWTRTCRKCKKNTVKMEEEKWKHWSAPPRKNRSAEEPNGEDRPEGCSHEGEGLGQP